MKLQRLFVKGYKNLIDFTIDFQRGNGLSMLVGNNGSGKSNLLEAISGIFHDLFRQDKGDRKIDCDYSLEYELDGVNCKLEQINGTLRCYGEKFKRREQFIAENAPNNIIGLYSGEEDRLWTQFYEHYYKTYMRRIKENQYQGRMKLVFINKYYWNIALLTLLLSSNDTLKPFIENDLGIRTVDEVVLTYNFRNYEQANNLLKAFIDRINPEHKVRQKYSIDDLKQAIFYDFLATSNGEHIVDSNGTHILVNSGITDVDVFRNLTQGCMPKDSKVISHISIIMNGGITVQQLSEGEKKLILVKAVLEILADEKSLILMDEPDAHLHEGRKPALIDLMRDYPNRQIIVATHSPIIAQLASDEELLMIECNNGKATLMSDEKKEKIKRLTGSAWDIIGQEMILKSSHPLVLFEGKTDVEYTKRAMELLKPTKPEYNTITVDFLNANGAGNIKSFLDNLFELITPSKKVIVFLIETMRGKKAPQLWLGFQKMMRGLSIIKTL